MANMPQVLKEVLQNVVKKPYTKLYPFEKLRVSKDLRGRPKVLKTVCIGCGLCRKACPAMAIEYILTEIEKYPQPNGKKVIEVVKDGVKYKPTPAFFLNRCIFCGMCAEVCPVLAIEMSNEYELAGYSRSELVKLE